MTRSAEPHRFNVPRTCHNKLLNVSRVPEGDVIFEGVAAEEEPEEIGRYCSCNHRVLRGMQCKCGGGELVETCDVVTSGELTDVIGCMEKTSRKTRDDGDYDVTIDNVDIDLDYIPPVNIHRSILSFYFNFFKL